MKRSSLLFLPLLLVALCSHAFQGKPSMPTPPEPLDQSNAAKPPNQPTITRHVDMAHVQEEAAALARTAQTIPADVASVRQGLLPKDVVQKLKQIEKLSKHLRSELSP